MSKICMNGLCGATTTTQWKKGWLMKAGGFATLCYVCGSTYDNLNYCERFHLNEPGWRECKFCEKPVHCGCVVSKYLHECLDLGGISCIKCARGNGMHPLKQSVGNEIPNGFARFSAIWNPTIYNNQNQTNNPNSINIRNLTQLVENPISSINHQFNQVEETQPSSSSLDINRSFRNPNPLPLPPIFQTQLPPENNNNNINKLNNLGFQQSSFGFGLVNSSGVSEKVSSFKHEQKPLHAMVQKPVKPGISIRLQAARGMGSTNRVAKPPAEGRARSQLLPRYWPKMTDQELLQISGDLNSDCTITPLFEKVLSASDAGRIGRLVLPKACAEAYFPPIDQSEGLPINIRDIKGTEWTFQFRFWPNNNSRMYVLEGVNSCIQNLQLQAGDTVIFSRLNPGDKLIIGCRKATCSPPPNTVNVTENGNLPTNVEQEGVTKWDLPVNQEGLTKKMVRNIGSKSKRLHIDNEDAMELKFTWEEAQEFLRPPPSKPTVVVIDDCELEEYDEPPVFGKRTIFTMNASRVQEQWVQCDSCSKWRKLSSDILVLSKWTCSHNISDPDRCVCSAPEEKGARDLDRILRLNNESKKRKIARNWGTEEDGSEALATVAVTGGENTIAGPTTKHPRHRAGCSCIVCIQPPSGKGKHKPNCICNVCSTVRRRFKTLMLRKRKRLSEPDETKETESVEVKKGEEEELDLNCDPKAEEEILLANANIHPQWRNVLQGLVPKGTSDVSNGCMVTNEKVVEGS